MLVRAGRILLADAGRFGWLVLLFHFPSVNSGCDPSEDGGGFCDAAGGLFEAHVRRLNCQLNLSRSSAQSSYPQRNRPPRIV